MTTYLRSSLKRVFTLAVALGFSLSNLSAQTPTLNHVVSVPVGGEASAEIVAYDSQNQVIWVLNSPNQTIDKFDFSIDVTNPTPAGSFDFSSYGGGVNSIAIFGTTVAIAVEAETKTDNGKVVFINSTDNSYLGEAAVGALPDMLTFTHDGMKVLVANEGEPSSDYTIDPVGSISIVDISAGVASPTVSTAGFEAWNDHAASLMNNGVKLGGPGERTVAQNLEPEYITVSEDDRMAYVSLQENNAIAVVDLTSGMVVDILPLGFKDHMSGTATVDEYYINEIANLPELGLPHYQDEAVMLGGFSGLFYDETQSTETELVFYAVPDRGPNEGTVAKADIGTSQNARPFKLPNYQGRIVKFMVNTTTGDITLNPSEQIMLQREEVIYLQDFEDETAELDDWTGISYSSSNDWRYNDYSGDNFAEMNGYNGDATSSDYLISPMWDLSGVDAPMLSFYTTRNFSGDSTLQVLISNDYDESGDPESFTWTNITENFTFSQGNYEDVYSGMFDISDYATANTYIAFYYYGTPSGSYLYQLDDIKISTVAPISGKGNIPGVDEIPVTETDASAGYPNADFTANGRDFHQLPYDPFGGDFEGVLRDKDGNFWMCDEYRPAIYQFDASGMLMHRYVAEGTSVMGDTPQEAGYYGEETLPAVYAKRRANRGFEAIAYDEMNEVIYAFIQSPIENPSSAVRNNTDVIRILGISAIDGTVVSEYVYLLERNSLPGIGNRVDKIGDAVYLGNGKFYVLERDSSVPADGVGQKYVFEINLLGATDLMATTEGMALSSLTDTTGSDMLTLENMSATQLAQIGVMPVHKRKVVNLPSVGYWGSDKPEGIAALPDGSIAVVNDNDFGLAGAGVTDNTVLGIINFDNNYGFDASNRDDAINITSQYTLGMYQPDAISSFMHNDMTFIVTANEGDARDYWFDAASEEECLNAGGIDYDEDDGCLAYSEETRAGDLTFDPSFEGLDSAMNDELLGRLKTTIEMGDIDGDGFVDELYSYGARSFSIFDMYGNLVYDSGDDFEQITASYDALAFNASDGLYEEFDDRSDDKGPEPEGVVLGEIDGKLYAFIGLERTGGIMMYDVTDPNNVMFVDYINTTDFNDGSGDVSPEGLAFISADDSPTGDAFLLVSYEYSGTMAVFEVGDGQITSTFDTVNESFVVFPNPTRGLLNIGVATDVEVQDMNGVTVLNASNTTTIDLSDLASGMYVVKLASGAVAQVSVIK